MNCQFAEDEILKSLDGLLTAGERERLDSHLDSCADCRRVWDEHRLLARAAVRWTRPVPQDDPGEAFTAAVLARIAARSEPVSSRQTFWLPLAATMVLMALLAFLPTLHEFGLQPIDASVRQMPGWLWTNLRAVPGDAFATWTVLTAAAALPSWIWGLLAAAGSVNALFCVQARQSHARRRLS